MMCQLRARLTVAPGRRPPLSDGQQTCRHAVLKVQLAAAAALPHLGPGGVDVDLGRLVIEIGEVSRVMAPRDFLDSASSQGH